MFFSVSAECGVSKVIQKRMVNGAKASPGAWPWMASIQFYGENFCGGTLISPKWVSANVAAVNSRFSSLELFCSASVFLYVSTLVSLHFYHVYLFIGCDSCSLLAG